MSKEALAVDARRARVALGPRSADGPELFCGKLKVDDPLHLTHFLFQFRNPALKCTIPQLATALDQSASKGLTPSRSAAVSTAMRTEPQSSLRPASE